MSQNDQDSTNQNEQSQPCRIPKPAHINQYFDKIQANPKLWQLQAKLKPNPTDKFTKFTYKTHNNSLHGWRWLNISKLKFQTKQGKTKISINMKMIDNITQERKPNKKSNNQLDQRKEVVPDQKINQKSIKKQGSNGSKGQGQGPDGGDLDVSLSTSYDDTKLNIRIKDRGQLDIKVNQTIDITASLKTQLEYTYQHRKNTGLNKYSAVLFYTTGVGKWINQILANQFIKKDNSQYLPYHKNQTRIKARISDHSDPQINITSINHFGQIKYSQNKIPIPKQNKQKQNKQKQKQNQQIKIQPQQKQTQIKQNQILKSKLQFDNKLTLLRKQGDGFNFKTLFNFESVVFKQIIKLQTTINDRGFNAIQSKYICKYWPKLVLGCQLGTNYNSHTSQWHKKWQLVLQKQNVDYLGNVALSISSKHAGVRIIKKVGEYRFEMMGSGKWNAKGVYQPKFGIKINLNL